MGIMPTLEQIYRFYFGDDTQVTQVQERWDLRDDDARSRSLDLIDEEGASSDTTTEAGTPDPFLIVVSECEDGELESSCANEREDSPEAEPLPAWLLEHCVQTAEELCAIEVPFEVFDDETTGDSSSEKYQVPRVVFEELANVLDSQPSENESSADSCDDRAHRPTFSHNVVYIRFPGKTDEVVSRSFYDSAAQYFSKTAGADLVTLCTDDLVDLLPWPHQRPCHASRVWTSDFAKEYDLYDGDSSEADSNEADSKVQALVLKGLDLKRLLDGPNQKRAQRGSVKISFPLVVHLRFPDVHPGEQGRLLLKILGDAISASKDGAILVLTPQYQKTRDYLNRFYDFGRRRGYPGTSSTFASAFDQTNCKVRKEAIRLAPRRTPQQQRLIHKHKDLEHPFRHSNVRFLQRTLRSSPSFDKNDELCSPYAEYKLDWENPAIPNDRPLEKGEMADVIATIKCTKQHQQTLQALRRLKQRNSFLREWTDNTKSDMNEDESQDNRKTFPEVIRCIIRRIQSDPDLAAESRLLTYLVDPSDLEEGLSDLAVDAETEKVVKRLIAASDNNNTKPYGILKHQSKGGILLYGPPGTGKTHLARVVAFESKSVMLSVSPADIMSKWLGETESSIKTLFSLARLLHPCLLFIDEADSLFRARSDDDKSWERNQVNQLLHEMEGLKRSDKAPSVILATNNPHSLDRAVLRRVPGRAYLGLPRWQQRLQILRICLREEVQVDCDHEELALQTRGYSGSDIRNVCVLAAQINEEQLRDTDVRQLRQPNFTEALQHIHPTVSDADLKAFMKFAEAYDRPVFEKFRLENARKGRRITSIYSQNEKSLGPFSPLALGSPSTWNVDDLKAEFISSRTDHASIQTHSSRSHVETQVNEGSFEYKPLEPMEIRVLRILQSVPNDIAGVGQDMIRCELKTVDLHDCTNYWNSLTTNCQSEWTTQDSPSFRIFLWLYLHEYFSSNSQNALPPVSHQQVLASYINSRWARTSSVKETSPLSRFRWGDYVALSYVWGNEDPCNEIMLDGHRFAVRPNLHAALRHLRDSFEVKTGGLYVWVDAICINQDDRGEREVEVKKMEMIYSQCMKVIAWLGSPSSHFTCQFSKVAKLLSLTSSLQIPKLVERVERVLDFDLVQPLLDAAPFLLFNEYWERLWVVQEIMLAPSLSIRASGLEILPGSFYMFIQFWTLARELSDSAGKEFLGPTSYEPMLIAMTRLRLMVSSIANRGEWAPHELVQFSRRSKATDPRDLVYGLIAMYPKQVKDELLVSYDPSVTAEDTHWMFTKAYVLGLRDLDVLATVGWYIHPKSGQAPLSRKDNLKHTPTWVTRPNEQVGFSDTEFDTWPAASNARNNDFQPYDVCFSTDNHFLCCNGVLLDNVQALGAMAVGEEKSGAAQGMFQLDVAMDENGDILQDHRLSLARVLTSSPKFNFRDGPSILDIPWMDELGLAEAEIEAYENQTTKDSVPSWLRALLLEGTMRLMLKYLLWPNKFLKIGERSLKSYFNADWDKAGHSSLPVIASWSKAWYTTGFGRLFTSSKGILGYGPLDIALGDRIAILSRCGKPLILRPVPNEEHYEVVGWCYVDGYMMGEVKKEFEEGRVTVEQIKLG